MPTYPLEAILQARRMGFTRFVAITTDEIGMPIVLDGIGADGLPLDYGEALVYQRSTGSNFIRFAPSQAGLAGAPATGAAAAGGVKSASNVQKVRIGIGGSLWVSNHTAGASSSPVVFYR